MRYTMVDTIQPFIGVCGVQNSADYKNLVHHAASTLPGTGCFLMAGIKNGRLKLDPLHLSPSVQPFVHCDFNLSEPFEKTVQDNILQTRQYVRGLQLNILPWMDTDYGPFFRYLKRRYPHIKLVLQAHRDIVYNYTPIAIAQRVKELPVDYLLFDASQSKGVLFDLNTMREYTAAAQSQNPHIGVVVAGGLSGGSIPTHFKPLVALCPSLSCDAFLGLQDRTAAKLSWPLVQDYLNKWRAVMLGERLMVPHRRPGYILEPARS